MSEWQPIETAPKDGAEILVIDKAQQCWLSMWNRKTEMWESDYLDNLKGLTHWMPLPAPPEATP
jgi:hypothetical protein